MPRRQVEISAGNREWKDYSSICQQSSAKAGWFFVAVIVISVVSQESSDRPLLDSQFAQISGCLNDFECEQVSRQRPGVVTDLADVPIVVRDRLLPEIEAEGCAGSVSGAVIISKEIASRVSPKPV